MISRENTIWLTAVKEKPAERHAGKKEAPVSGVGE
jgi:hypothetical protein